MKKLFAVFQKIGRSLMLPVSVLPAAGLLFRLGQEDLLGRYGAAFKYLATAGDAIFTNLPMIFAVGVAIGFSGGEAVAALAAVVGQIILQAIMAAGSKNIGTAIDMGVFGGISIGLISATLYNRYYSIKLPQVLGFFSGKRFIPIITSVAALIFASVGVSLWPVMQQIIDTFAGWASTSILGPAFYAAGKRLLIPIGLHHVYYPVFLYQFGSFTAADGITYFGDTARYFHGDKTAGMFMASEYPILMFGLPAAALAIIAAAREENRKKISGIMISAALVSFLTGITEPIEFSFIFVAPILFLFHVGAAFSAGIVTSLLNIRLGYTFSASAIDYVLGYKFAEHPLLIWAIGMLYFITYFIVFYFTIIGMDIKTPGREDIETSLDNIKAASSERASMILEAVGGADNVEMIDACITRLRLTLKNRKAVNKVLLRKTGSSGTLELGNSIQIIYGTEAESIKDDVKAEIIKSRHYKQNIGELQETAEGLNLSIQLENPIKGEVIHLEKIPDEVFSDRMLGDGFAIKPKDNKVYSPVKGIVKVLFPTNHAVAVRTEEGIEVLIHVGIDTVALKGEGFTAYVKQGDRVEKGDLLITFNRKLIEEKAKSNLTPVIVTNMEKVDRLNVTYGKMEKGKIAAEIILKNQD